MLSKSLKNLSTIGGYEVTLGIIYEFGAVIIIIMEKS